MNTTPLPKPPTNPHHPRRREIAMTLVASLVLMVFLGMVLMINANQNQAALPMAPTNPMAVSLHQVDLLGRGQAYDALWTPDGQRFIVTSSAGIWVYDSIMITPYNIYPEIAEFSSLVFSADSRYLAFVSKNIVYMWDLVEKRDLPSRPSRPFATAIALNTDGSLLAAGSRKGEIIFYNTATNLETSRTPIFGHDITKIQFDSTGTRLAYMDINEGIYQFTDPSGTWSRNVSDTDMLLIPPMRFAPERKGSVKNFNYNRDGTWLAGRIGTDVLVWDTRTGEQVHIFSYTGYPEDDALKLINLDGDLTFSPDGREMSIIQIGLDLWTVDREQSTVRHPLKSAGLSFIEMGGVRFKPDWTALAMVRENGEITLYDLTTDTIAQVGFDDHTLGPINDVAFSPDSQQVSSVSDILKDPFVNSGDELLLWTVGADTPPIEVIRNYQSLAFGADVSRAIFSPDNQFLTTFIQNGNGIQLWNRDGSLAKAWSPPDYEELVRGMPSRGALAYNADGTRLLSIPARGSVLWIWDTQKGKVAYTIPLEIAPSDRLTAAALSPDGSSVAVAYTMDDAQSIILYDVTSGQPVKTLVKHKADIRTLVYSPDGASLLSASVDGRIYLWDLTTDAEPPALLEKGGSSVLAISPDGRRIVGVDTYETELIVWDAKTGTELIRQPEAAYPTAMAFNGDGTRLAVGLINGTIQIWGIDHP